MSERDDLRDFLDQVQRLIERILDQGELIPADLRHYFVDAWPDVKDNLDLARRSIMGVAQDRLRAAGLTGAQLALKLFGFRRWSRRIDWMNLLWSRRAVKGALNWANIILGSLSFVPGVEPAKEFKDAIERAVDEAEAG